MAAFTGMDIQAVRTLAQQMTSSAQEIEQLMQRLTAALQGTPWVGPDREQFLSEWQGQHVAALRNVAQNLQDASARANANANEQETASS